jgi:hypothetical protein
MTKYSLGMKKKTNVLKHANAMMIAMIVPYRNDGIVKSSKRSTLNAMPKYHLL